MLVWADRDLAAQPAERTMKRSTKKLTVTRETLVNLTLVRGGDGTSTQPGSSLRADLCNTKNCPVTNGDPPPPPTVGDGPIKK